MSDADDDEVQQFRVSARECWEAASAGWEANATDLQRSFMPVSVWMLDAVAPQPGQTILEIAAGPGDTGLMAAELLRPGGTLICTDGAEAMVAIAQARAEERGLTDVVQTRTMEAEWLDQPTATVDAVLCRFGYMLLADPETALRETRRVLRPGGRVALAVWADRAENPQLATPTAIGVELGLMQAGPAGAPGPFALADPVALAELLAVAGFADVVVEPVDVSFAFADLDAAWRRDVSLSPTLKALTKDASPADHYRLRDAYDARLAPYVAADGSVTIPGRVLAAAATA